MTRTLVSLVSLVIVMVVLAVSTAWLARLTLLVSYESLTAVPLDVFSYYVVAANVAIVRAHKRPLFTGLRALPASERNRCWDLMREIVKVFLYAPDRFASLERVVRAYAEDLPHPQAPEVGTGTVTPDDSDSKTASDVTPAG